MSETKATLSLPAVIEPCMEAGCPESGRHHLVRDAHGTLLFETDIGGARTALIVRALNSHEGLVEALERAAAIFDDIGRPNNAAAMRAAIAMPPGRDE